MNTTALRYWPLYIALLAACPLLRAQDAAPPAAKRAAPPTEIVISKGTFEWNGQKGPATLRRVVDAITARYPRANITIVGADNLVLEENVTLRLRRTLPDGSGTIEPPLHGMLAALRAASRGRFRVEGFGDNDFVLSTENPHSTTRAEVFKLRQTPAGRPPEAALRAEIEKLETELAVMGRRYGPDHPQMKDVAIRRDIVKETLNRAAPALATPKLLAQIEEVVLLTLERLRPGDPPPEFKYHPGSGLLVVIGSEAAIDVTRKVVDAIQ
jgi:hypothetical protein